jgi:hypothetical protein
MKKYCLHPGYVTSATDGDRHYIDAPRLAALYGVSMAECITVTGKELKPNKDVEQLKQLYPRFDGKYTLD